MGRRRRMEGLVNRPLSQSVGLSQSRSEQLSRSRYLPHTEKVKLAKKERVKKGLKVIVGHGKVAAAVPEKYISMDTCPVFDNYCIFSRGGGP